MADKSEYKYFHVIDTSGTSERSLGVAAVNSKGEFGFNNDTDEKPYLPAGEEKALTNKGVSESLTYEQFHWGENIKLKETQTSKLRNSEKESEKKTSTGVTVENTIESSKTKTAASTKPESNPKLEGIEKDQLFEPASGETKLLVPKEISKKFVQDGNKFYFKGSEDKLAFQDNGSMLKTKVDGDLVADSMIAIAKNRGWSELKVTGTESFKKDIWKKATEQGIAVKGYRPTKVELAEMKGKGVEIPKQGQSTSPEKSTLTPEQEKAKAFKDLSSSEAVKKHPELAPYVAAVTAIEKKIQSEKLSDENKKAIMNRVRMNAENSINQGVTPNISLKEIKTRTVTAEAEVSR